MADDANAKAAMEQFRGSLADENGLAEVEQALRETLRMLVQDPAGGSGGRIAELRLTEVILGGSDAGRPAIPSAWWRQPSRTSRHDSGSSLTCSSDTCSPRPGPAWLRHDPAAPQLACAALAVAAETAPALRITLVSDNPRRLTLRSANWSSSRDHPPAGTSPRTVVCWAPTQKIDEPE
jgi:hypothetical protein